MKYGYVSVAVLDLWGKPRFNSGRVHQLLFTEPVKIHEADSGYAYVEDTGGYRGWGLERHVRQIPAAGYKKILSARPYVVKARSLKLYCTGRGESAEPPVLYYGTALPIDRFWKGLARIVLPHGDTALVHASGIVRPSAGGGPKISGQVLVREAKRFLGVPYLWGGVTSTGFDCSGLVQTVCRRFGLSVPRDTKDQIKVGQPVPDRDIKTGDLLFFDRHVGFAIGRNRLVHCSVAGGGVRVESLEEGTAGYRADLKSAFKEARRLVYVT